MYEEIIEIHELDDLSHENNFSLFVADNVVAVVNFIKLINEGFRFNLHDIVEAEYKEYFGENNGDMRYVVELCLMNAYKIIADYYYEKNSFMFGVDNNEKN